MSSRNLWPIYTPVDLDVWKRVLIRRCEANAEFDRVATVLEERYSDVRRGRHTARYWVFYVPLTEYEARVWGTKT